LGGDQPIFYKVFFPTKPKRITAYLPTSNLESVYLGLALLEISRLNAALIKWVD
jgi:hypothetical protein